MASLTPIATDYETLISSVGTTPLLQDLQEKHVAFLATKKTCRVCGKKKPRSEFSKHSHSTDNRDSRCKACKKEQNTLTREFRKEHPIPEGHSCPLCLRTVDRWHLDHCHITEQPRGYLCPTCNASLGGFQDDPQILQRAIDWIKSGGDIQIPELTTRPPLPRHLL